MRKTYPLILIFFSLILFASACTPSSPPPQTDADTIGTMVALTTAPILTQSAPATQAPPPTPQPTLSDEELIRQALLAKLGWTAAELDFSMGTNTGTVARGTVKKVGEMQGAAWFAGKDNTGTWIIAHIGQGIPYCSDIQAFTFSTDWISHCIDASENVVALGQPPAPTLTDEEAIRQALLAKLGWTAAELDFSMGDNTGIVARGSLKKVGEMSGAAWFAGKDNAGTWIIAHIGQGIPYCSDIQAFNFPTDWISHCADASDNVVER